MKKHKPRLALGMLILLLIGVGITAQAQTISPRPQVKGIHIENVYIPPGSDDDQQILIIGELVCESAIGVTKTKNWGQNITPDYGDLDGSGNLTPADNGEHTYDTDDHFTGVRTPIARVEPASPTQNWAFKSFQKFIFFDDKDLYGVWSFNYSKTNSNDAKAYSNQKDYFVETWRSYADTSDMHYDTISSSNSNVFVAIKSAPGFSHLARLVNNGESHSNTWFNLTTTICLKDHYWEPVGYGDLGDNCGINPQFDGKFDGRGHFIDSALTILPVTCMGMFGDLGSTGKIIRTFDYDCNFTYTFPSVTWEGSTDLIQGHLGGIVGRIQAGGEVDGCEAAVDTVARYQGVAGVAGVGSISGAGNVNSGGIAGSNLGTIRNSFAVDSKIGGTFVGGLAGSNSGTVANAYTKRVSFEGTPTNEAIVGVLVGINGTNGSLTNAYTDATSGAIVGSGTAGSNVYAAAAAVTGATPYTPVINADHLGYMYSDNIISGKTIPLFDTLNSKVTASNGYAYWARPALSCYDESSTVDTYNSNGEYVETRFTKSYQPLNGDLPVLRLCESHERDFEAVGYTQSVAYQGGFRTVGTRGAMVNVLQYGGPDRDGTGNKVDGLSPHFDGYPSPQLDGAFVRGTYDDCLFIYGDITAISTESIADDYGWPEKFYHGISIYEHVAILDTGKLATHSRIFMGVTFDNNKNALSTLNVNELTEQPLSRNWHLFSTPLITADIGFYYTQNGHNQPVDYENQSHVDFDNTPYDPDGYYNNPWTLPGNSAQNNHGGTEFGWLNGDTNGHNRYWMMGWNKYPLSCVSWTDTTAWTGSGNTLNTGTKLIDLGEGFPLHDWQDGYWPSKVNLTAVSREALDLSFVNPRTTDSTGYWSDENPEQGLYRYPYGMDFYSYNEPKYHYINFKRNGPNHWHTDAPHLHLDYTPEVGSNNPKGEYQYPTNHNENYLITGKGYIATIGIKTFLQAHGSLKYAEYDVNATMDRYIEITRTENPLHISEGWNLLGNPYHAYLDFDKLVADTSSVGQHNAGLLSKMENDATSASTEPFYVMYNASSFNDETEIPESALKYYVKGGSSGGKYANRYLHPHQGFYVRMKEGLTRDSIEFRTNMTVARADVPNGDGTFRDMGYTPAYPLVNLFLSSDKGCADVCVVEFNRPEGWTGATKLRELRQGNGLLYAMHDDHNYAAVFVPEDATRVPIKFESKSKEGDTYTLSWETANGDFQKLILVDNITGVQYDMLRNSSYSFHGKKEDYWSRFYITFEVTGIDEEIDDDEDDASTGSSTFAFYDGEQWIVTGSGTLDLIDLQGRILHHTTLGTDGQTRIGLPDVAKGMYLLRMNNNHGTKVQKIIVK